MLHIPDLTTLDVTVYTLDYMAGVWPQQEEFTFSYGTYLHTRVFLSVTYNNLSLNLIEGNYFHYRMANDGCPLTKQHRE